MTALPKPLYQDPIYGSPTDPMLLWYPREQLWYLFYTQRRATDQYVGVSWVHGTRIGVATSPDGHKWLYRGTLPDLDIEPGCNTFWAPEIIPVADGFHMFVSYVQGVPTDWDYPRQILHYTSNDLWHWTFQAAVDLQSDRVIDACIYQVKPDLYKMWYKDEARDSLTTAAISPDLYHWTVLGPEITDCHQEGPNVFEFAGHKWLIADYWQGLAVYRSEDFSHWERCQDILADRGEDLSDSSIGHHADVLVSQGRAFIVYFVTPHLDRPTGLDQAGVPRPDPLPGSLLNQACIQIAELFYQDGQLHCRRNDPVYW